MVNLCPSSAFTSAAAFLSAEDHCVLPRQRCPLRKVGQKLRPPPSQPLPVYKVALLALVFGFLVCKGRGLLLGVVSLPVKGGAGCGCGLAPGRGAGLAVGVVSLLVRGRGWMWVWSHSAV